MLFKNFFNQFNISSQCKRYGLPLWQCPTFLFLLMGLMIISSTLITYFIGRRYIEDPEIVVLIVLSLTAFLFIVAFSITRSFERLAEANRLKSEFISIVSHQLRSPLSNLSWTIELLMSGRLGVVEEKQVEYFKILKENITRMGDLVSDLLIVSRLETATLPIKKKEFSLSELIKSLAVEFKIFAEASNVELKLNLPEGMPDAFADDSQIRLVVENLIENAIRYVKNKGTVEISLEQKGDSIYFRIKDSGVGIPKADQKFIFQKFFRSANVLKSQTQGSGLGLYIAKSIIEKSGGKIGFQSEENKGSTFWFTLPIK